MRVRRSELLLEDPELGERLSRERVVAAVRDCVARAVQVQAGAWSAAGLGDLRDGLGDLRDGVGLLVLDGLIVRRVGIAGRFGAELLGQGDVLRPWQNEDAATTLSHTGRWRALRDGRIAVLDRDFLVRAAKYPEVISALFARAVRRSRHRAVAMAIVHQPRVEVRLRMLFWELADRWGTVHADGVHVPLALTHEVLADLVAARRPTVSKALGDLARRSSIRWVGAHWLLPGDPPRELNDLGATSRHRLSPSASSAS